jgi:hypothetical protein
MLEAIIAAFSGLNTAIIASKLCEAGRIEEARELMTK